MTNIIDDGGPAFPVPVSSGYGPGFFSENLRGEREFTSIEGGLTIRDYFASQALSMYQSESMSTDSIAEVCYQFADAMIRTRKAKT